MSFFDTLGKAIGIGGGALSLFEGVSRAFGDDDIEDLLEQQIDIQRGITNDLRALADYDTILQNYRSEVPKAMRELLRQQSRQVARGNPATVIHPERRDESLSSLILRMGPELEEAARSTSANILSGAGESNQGISGMINNLGRQEAQRSSDVFNLAQAMMLLGGSGQQNVTVNTGKTNPYANAWGYL